MIRESVEKDKPLGDVSNEFFAEFNLYTHMAHYVGKVLHMRPLEILTTWGVPELIVAYGQYANEVSTQIYEEWRHQPAESRGEKPEKYIVKFLSDDRLEDEE